MFKLRLNAKECISCGICMDVCQPRAISMQVKATRSIEGPHLTFEQLRRGEPRVLQLMTFPFLSSPELCNGCGRCVRECPVIALDLLAGWETAQTKTACAVCLRQ